MYQKNVILQLIVLLITIALSSCGYQFQGGGSILPPDIKRVYIPVVENRTTEAGLDYTVTEALRDQFERYGVLTVTEKQEDADAILNAAIVSLKRDTQTSTSQTDTALQTQTVLTLAAELRRVDGNVLWRNKGLSVARAFGATGDVVVTSSADFASGSLGAADLSGLEDRQVSRGQEEEILSQLAEQLARRVYNEAVAPDF
ncbi:MAG: hypothetical protein D6719_05550 [Candidatus Dadabacteria bacterium]|nr:MAG: hypothetical protein D6719_05550 [Candidatus Dadabacteria bacterium]